MKFTIITCTWNSEKYLNRCLDSVCSQFKSIEHVIVDNCSSDDTLELVKIYEKENPHIDVKLISERDKGLSDALNKGMAMSTGDYMIWLHSDEFLEANILNKVENTILKHPGYQVYFGDTNFRSEDLSLQREKIEHRYNRAMLLYYGCYIQTASTFIHRSVLEKSGQLLSDYKVSMDHEWYVRMAYSDVNFKPLEFTVSNFIWHEHNISKVLGGSRIEFNRTRLRYGILKLLPTRLRIFIFNSIERYWQLNRVLYRKWCE